MAARRGVGVLALAAVVAAAGCGDDGLGPSGTLTSEQLQVAVLSIFNGSVVRAQRVLPPRLPEAAAGLAGTDASVPPDGPMAALVQVSADTTDLAVPCSVSGSLRFLAEYDGNIDDENGNFDLRYRVEQGHDDCVEGASGGVTVGIDARPGVVATFEAFSLDEGRQGVAGNVNGTLEVTTEDGPVVCTLEMNVTGEGEEGQIIYQLLGRFCGDAFQARFESGV